RSPDVLGHLGEDGVDAVGQSLGQGDRAEALVVVVLQRDTRDRLGRVAVDDRVGRVLAAVDARGGGHHLERRAGWVLALGGAIQLTGVRAGGVVVVVVVAGVGVHRQHRARPWIQRDDGPGAS